MMQQPPSILYDHFFIWLREKQAMHHQSDQRIPFGNYFTVEFCWKPRFHIKYTFICQADGDRARCWIHQRWRSSASENFARQHAKLSVKRIFAGRKCVRVMRKLVPSFIDNGKWSELRQWIKVMSSHLHIALVNAKFEWTSCNSRIRHIQLSPVNLLCDMFSPLFLQCGKRNENEEMANGTLEEANWELNCFLNEHLSFGVYGRRSCALSNK